MPSLKQSAESCRSSVVDGESTGVPSISYSNQSRPHVNFDDWTCRECNAVAYDSNRVRIQSHDWNRMPRLGQNMFRSLPCLLPLLAAFATLACGCNRNDAERLGRIGTKVSAHAKANSSAIGAKVDL